MADAAATQRLSGALRHRAERYRTDAALDLTLVDALVRMDELEAAADTLDGHRESLQALARDLQEVVADAAVERDVALARPPSVSGIRRRAMAATSAAAVMLTLLLPAGRTLPRTILAAVEGRLENAGDSTPTPLAQPTTLRSWAERRRNLVSASPEQRRELGNAMARDTVRAILAADKAGGSAAADQPGSDRKVISLDAARATRRDVRAARDAEQTILPMPPRPPVDESQMDAEALDALVEPADPDLP